MIIAAILATALVAQNPYGVCAHITRDEFATRDESLKLMSRAGIGMVRSDFDWWVKWTPDSPWNLSHFDEVIKSAEAEGIVVLPIVNSAPRWAAPILEHRKEFGEYVSEVTRLVKGRCPVLEIWNEENLPSNGSLANPTNYLSILKTAYEAVKAVDPDTKVAFGGVSEFGFDYLREVYKLGGAKYFDIFCCHPYTLPFAPEGRLDKGLEKLRVLMSEYGDTNKPIWITEMGFPTHRNGIGTTETQAMLSGLKIARPEQRTWRVAYAPAVANEKARDFAAELLNVLPKGSTSVSCTPTELKSLLATNGVDAVIYPMDSEAYASDTVDAVAGFVRDGGVLVETGGAPVYYPMMTDAAGNGAEDKSHNPEEDRRKLRIGFTAWWLDKDVPNTTLAYATEAAVRAGFKAHPAGYRGGRFITSEYLRDGDELIPVIAAKSKSGKELSVAAVLKFDSDYKGAVIVCGLQAEYGPVAHTEEEQAKFIVRSTAISLAEGVEKFFPYEFKATELDPYYSEHHFGIVHADFKPKPAYCAFSTLTHMRPSGSAVYRGEWHNATGNTFYPQWICPDGKRAGMFWTLETAGERVLEFDVGDIEFTDMYGNPLPAGQVGPKRFSVYVSDKPVYFCGGFIVR